MITEKLDLPLTWYQDHCMIRYKYYDNKYDQQWYEENEAQIFGDQANFNLKKIRNFEGVLMLYYLLNCISFVMLVIFSNFLTYSSSKIWIRMRPTALRTSPIYGFYLCVRWPILKELKPSSGKLRYVYWATIRRKLKSKDSITKTCLKFKVGVKRLPK